MNDVRQDLRHTELLAAYIVAATKERIEGCGNYTAIVSLHSPAMVECAEGGRLVVPPQLLTHVPAKKIRKWEDSFAAKWVPRQVGLLEELIEEELATDLALSPADQTQS
jgi:hypothetical protein